MTYRGFSEMQLDQPQAAIADNTRAATLGDAYSMDMLGRIYLVGRSVPQDRDKAIEWLRRAVALGYQASKELLPLAMNKDLQPLLAPGGPKL